MTDSQNPNGSHRRFRSCLSVYMPSSFTRLRLALDNNGPLRVNVTSTSRRFHALRDTEAFDGERTAFSFHTPS